MSGLESLYDWPLPEASHDPVAALDPAATLIPEDPAERAVTAMRSLASSLPRDPIDDFAEIASRVKAFMPSEEEFRSMRAALDAAKQMRLQGYESPDFSALERIPYLKLAAGLFSPTRTGSFSEALWRGISGYAEGLQDVEARKLATRLRGLDIGYEMANKDISEALQRQGQGINALKGLIALRRAQEALNRPKSTPAMTELAWARGLIHQSPEEEAHFRSLTPEGQAAEIARRYNFLLFRHGAAAGKNTAVLSDPNIDPEVRVNLGKQMFGATFQRAYEQASKEITPEVYAGKSTYELMEARLRRAVELMGAIPTGFQTQGTQATTPPATSPQATAQQPAPRQEARQPAADDPLRRPIPTSEQREFEKQVAEEQAKTFAQIPSRLQGITSTLYRLDRMKDLTLQEGTFTGQLAELQAMLANIAGSLGLPVKQREVANTQEYGAHLAELVRGILASKELGSGTAISNVDLLFAHKPLPQLTASPRGRMQIINAMQRDLHRMRSDMEAALHHYRQHGSLRGFVPPSVHERKEYEEFMKKYGDAARAWAKRYEDAFVTTFDAFERFKQRQGDQGRTR